MNNNTLNALVLATVAALAVGANAAPAPVQDRMAPAMSSAMARTTNVFKGAEVNGGTAILTGRTLRLSPDLTVPKAPAPTWQVVDKDGNAFLLKQINIVGGKTNRTVEIPRYIKSVAKVQIYCTFAEVLLGEASFDKAIDLR